MPVNKNARVLFFVFFLSFLALHPFIVEAVEKAPVQALQDFIAVIQSIEFSSSNEMLNPELASQANQYLHLQAMVEKALGEHWDKRSEAQRETFMKIMWKLIEKIAYPQSRTFLGELEIEYKDPTQVDDGFEVVTVVKKEEEALDAEVIYLLHQREGVWKVYDVVLDGVSMTEDLSYQFESIIEESSFEGLLERMQEKLDQTGKVEG